MKRAKLFSGTRNASSWAMRAWLALREAEIEFDEEIVDIRRPQRFENLARLKRFSPSVTVPLLISGETTIFDSLAIMEYANDACGGHLLPSGPEPRAAARSLLAWQHSGLSSIAARISFESAFYPLKRRLSASEVAESARLFEHLEQVLGRSDGPFLFGSLSLADLILVPTIVRLTRHQLDLANWPRSKVWSQGLLARPSVSQWMEQADRLPHIWFDDYLIPGEPIELHEVSF